MDKKQSKQKKLTKKMKRKLAGIFGGSLLALVSLLVGITVISAKEGNKYTQQVLSQSQQQYTNQTVPFKRGSIVDRNGTVLANSIKVYNLILDCQGVNYRAAYKEPTIEALGEYFGISKSLVEELLTSESTKDSQYQILKKEVTMEERKAFEEANAVPETEEERKALGEDEIERRRSVQGIYFEDDYKRVYPLAELACDVIGFTNVGNEATCGLEGYYNSTLNGSNGRKFGYLSDETDLEQTIIDPVDGENLTITLDVTIQEIVEKYVNAMYEALSDGPNNVKNTKKKGARNIGVIIENPNNGEILAMASTGSYDLNDPRDLSSLYTRREIAAMDDEETKDALYKMWSNFCVSGTFEPGSTYKPIVVASALESGVITEQTPFFCDGGQEIGVDYVRCAVYPDSHGAQSLGEVIQNSCNDGMMAVGRHMGTSLFREYQQKFNFGTRTGIDLPNESLGMLFGEDKMYDMELATSSFGQGFTCTMIQEIAAMASVINGGTYYQPHLVREITNADGKVVESISPNILKQTVSEEVSADIREYMGMSVSSGTSKYAKVKGYSMGGKTGTAEKLNKEEDEDKDREDYLVSFIGFAPLDKPEMVVYVVVDTPNVEEQASSTYAQYLSQAIMSEVLPYMNIYQDEPTEEETVLWDGFSGIPKLTDIETDGISNPSGALAEEGFGDNTDDTEEYNNEETDGITNEAAGIDENDPSYGDEYGMDELTEQEE